MATLHIGETCTTCGTAVRKIMWGMPTEADVREAERKGWYIGGCCVDGRASRCDCGATAYDDRGQAVRGYPIDLVGPDDVVSLESARSKRTHPSSHRRP